MIRRPPRSTLFPSRRSSDLRERDHDDHEADDDRERPQLAGAHALPPEAHVAGEGDRKSTRLNSSHGYISYAVFCLKKKKKNKEEKYKGEKTRRRRQHRVGSG